MTAPKRQPDTSFELQLSAWRLLKQMRQEKEQAAVQQTTAPAPCKYQRQWVVVKRRAQ